MTDEIIEYNGFQVGDLITTYFAGFFVLEAIERRFLDAEMLRFSCYKDKQIGDEYSPLFYFRKVLTDEYKQVKRSTTNCCDASLCCKVDHAWICKQRNSHLRKMETIKDVIHKLERNRLIKGKA